MKMFKRNAIILTVIVFVCAAVYLNWAYNRETVIPTDDFTATDGLFYDGEDDLSAVGAEDEGDIASPVSDYFASARLARQQARDSAVSILRESTESTAASQESIDNSLASISAMAEFSLEEAEIESLIRAKGFSECVVFLNTDSITVTVPAPLEGLSESAISRITDVVLSETPLTYEQIKVVEVR